ncbi:hypothetical protein [Daejeonella sp. H1SJ63]|uniref:hypothetical protein n=1 Tax=Daejeonella sp. H1SJ63 TaxID=3034145 RepID=UPI0023ED14A3|nr:hypothetical protein [Daejeonella sp. H1SJ63]
MNRPDFIRSLGLGTSDLILPLNPLISTQSVKIYDNYIRGLVHYDFKKIRESIPEVDFTHPANVNQ